MSLSQETGEGELKEGKGSADPAGRKGFAVVEAPWGVSPDPTDKRG